MCNEYKCFILRPLLISFLGDAKRNCTKEDSWLEPNLFNCTSLNFRDLHKQVTGLFNLGANLVALCFVFF